MFKVGDKVKHTGVPGCVPYEVVGIDTNSRGEECLQFKGQNGIWFNGKYYTLWEAPPQTSRHKFADVIIAWANGAKVQFRYPGRASTEWIDTDRPMFEGFGYEVEYRVKPETKPDVVYICEIKIPSRGFSPTVHSAYQDTVPHSYTGSVNSKLTFDGETGKLKAVELI